MRKVVFYFFIVLICGFFLACSSQEKRIKELWEFEKTINYHNFTISEKEKMQVFLPFDGVFTDDFFGRLPNGGEHFVNTPVPCRGWHSGIL